ncbi:unnamed protein product [Blumeria hordei]|uniref:Uncharacterized protein n=1 Tax=Blumeria hordei TaxID=2867405 RepID=A0A383UZT4_BLUHO|nr:unnamed protein product [Blumeria hordei]
MSHTFQGPGTYVKAYCSFSLSTMDIVSKIFHDQTPVAYTSHVDFGGNEAEEIECPEYIEGLTAGADEAEGLKISRIWKHKTCLYSDYALRNQRILTKVDADCPIIIENFISAEHFFKWDFE